MERARKRINRGIRTYYYKSSAKVITHATYKMDIKLYMLNTSLMEPIPMSLPPQWITKAWGKPKQLTIACTKGTKAEIRGIRTYYYKSNAKVITHADLQDGHKALYADDGVHLSFLGNDIFILNYQMANIQLDEKHWRITNQCSTTSNSAGLIPKQFSINR
jgi:uncharacterized protein affecting Mg2+/Co2+ transport